MTPTHYNNTRLKTFRENPRVYYWKYESRALGGWGLDLTTYDKNLVNGEAAHAGLAAMYAGLGDWPTPLTEVYQPILDSVDPEARIFWEEQRDYTIALLERYNTWRATNDDFVPIQIEAEGVAPIGDSPYSHVFRCDLVINTDYGVRVLDHKTRGGSADAKYQKSWRYSPQMWGYCAGHQKASGQNVIGYTVNILRKLSLDTPDEKRCPSCKRTKARMPSCEECRGTGSVPRAKSELFLRVDEGFSDAKALRWTANTLQTIARIEYERELFESQPEAAWPMNPEDYFRWGASPSPFLDLDYSSDPKRWWDPHPELLDKFVARTADYVDTKTLIREDLK